MTYVMSTAKLNVTGMRWVGELAEHHFDIKYRPGRVSADVDTLSSADVDTLSRMSMDIDEYEASCSEHISKEAFIASVNAVLSNVTYDYITTIADIVSIDADMNLKPHASSNNARLKKVNLVEEQNKDPNISRILQFKNCGIRPSSKQRRREGPIMRQLLYEFDRLFVHDDGILSRKIGDHIQLVLPASLRRLLYQELHENMGHLGHERVYSLARDHCYWPFMGRDIEHFITKYCRCVRQKRPVLKVRDPLQPITSTTPFDLISIDFLHLDQSSGGYEYIMLIVDHFTKFVQGYATRNKSGHTAAERLFNEYIPCFGFPSEIIHDQGGEFENKMFKRLNELSGIKNLYTTPYHPEGNGIVERMNRTLLGMLRTLPEKHKSHWKDYLNLLLHAYNCTRHNTTGYSSYFLMFGRHPKLPLYIIFGSLNSEETKSYPKYVERWQNAMQEAYQLVMKKSQDSALKQKKQNDKHVRTALLLPGDCVLIKNMTPHGGPGKLKSYWEEEIHIVKSHIGRDSPVYKVYPESGHGRSRVLHRNMLLPCPELPADFAPCQPKIKNMSQKPTAVPNVYAEDGTSTAEIDYQEDGLDGLYPVELSTLQRNCDISNKVAKPSLQVTNPPVEVDSEKSGLLEPEVDGSNIVDSSTTYSPAESSDCSPHCPEDVSATSPPFSRPVHVRRPPMRLTYYRSGQPAYINQVSPAYISQVSPFYYFSQNLPYVVFPPPPAVPFFINHL